MDRTALEEIVKAFEGADYDKLTGLEQQVCHILAKHELVGYFDSLRRTVVRALKPNRVYRSGVK